MIRLAFIGIGLMGRPMSERLLRAGFSVAVWNRTPAKAAPLAELGARVCTTVEAALESSDVAISMLSSAASVADTLYESRAYRSLRPGSLMIDMSSIPPDTARAHAEILRRRAVDFLDAPVSGGTRGAQEGTLTIFAGGELGPFRRAEPVFAHLGRVHHVGASGAGQMAKLTNQIIVAGTIAAVAEGLAFATRAGLDTATLRSALLGGFAESRVLSEHGQRMVRRDFTPGAPNRIFLKDLRTILSAAAAVGADVPLSRSLCSSYEHLVAENKADLDHSSLILRYLPQ